METLTFGKYLSKLNDFAKLHPEFLDLPVYYTDQDESAFPVTGISLTGELKDLNAVPTEVVYDDDNGFWVTGNENAIIIN